MKNPKGSSSGGRVQPSSPSPLSDDNVSTWETHMPLCARMSGALNAISLSPEGNAVAVAGREVLKILSVSRTEVAETLNLRAGSHLTLNYSSNDVKWGNNATKQKVATAATNGAIILWDLNKVGRKAERVITEHSRAVNRVCFQPGNGNILLSASQDGTMKCWDFRDPSNGARYRFEGKSESVRDVQFSPVTPHEFAAAFETGGIQKWDMRNPKALFDRKVSAHNGPCLTVDWHPSGKLVASGGRDKTIKVWDMNGEGRRPLYTIRTMASVSRIQWRPGYEDEIASCALLTDNRIHVWDVRRPNIAQFVFDEHETTPTGFLWLNADVLYSCAKDKLFIRRDIQASYSPLQLLRRSGMGWNIQGDLAFAIDKSDRNQFIDESMIPKATTSTPKNAKRLSTAATLEEGAVQYIPPQHFGITHMPLFDYEAFSVLAENYELSGKDISAACEKNSSIAWNVGRYRTSQTWKIIGLLFDFEKEEKETENEDTRDESFRESTELEQIAAEKDIDSKEEDNTDEESDKDDEDSLTDESSTSSDTEKAEESSECVSDTEPEELWPAWQHGDIVMELLDYYTEEGDVQMCVSVYLVLEKYLQVDEARLEDWFTSYIELLHRFKLWSAATAIIKSCRITRVRERNENATTINIACNNCFKLVVGSSRGSWTCDKCNRLLNPCSVCHLTVKGLYVWCQGCNHGGHIEHLRDWFATETQCATGCGHHCVLSPMLKEP